jgi:putative nucleotidyltransferase with HDIG domain
LGRLGGFRIPVGYRIVFPFTSLCLLLGVFVSAVASQQLGAAAAARLDREAMREQYSVGAAFASFEQRRLTVLRTVSTLDGVAPALERADRQGLQARLYPLVANQLPDALTVSVVGAQGDELLRMAADPRQPSHCLCSQGGDVRSLPYVAQVLQGMEDDLGPKFAAAARLDSAWYAYAIGPVLDGQRVVGAILVAEPLSALAAEVRAEDGFDLALYAPDGTPMGASSKVPKAAALAADQRRNAMAGATVHESAGQAQLFYVPWMLRGRSAGYAAVVVPGDAVAAASDHITPLLAAVFGVGLGLTLLVGAAVTRSITRPLSQLLQATDRVAGGNLEEPARVTSNDEIGRLASSFNLMTRSLAEKTRRLEASAEGVVQTLAAAIDARDAYTHGHSIRVASYSVEIARRLGLSEVAVESIRRGCLIHDIGKIGVPDRILRKPGALSYEEEIQMRRHPADGYEMVRNLEWPEEVLQVVRHHHERWDGRGYPDGLAATRLPLAARIVAVADALDAMTSQRPYRLALTFTQAQQAIRSGASTQFDPAVVTAFVQSARRLRAMVETEAPAAPAQPVVLRSVS